MCENNGVDERVSLEIGAEIELTSVTIENVIRRFKIAEHLGFGGTAIAYKVSYDGSDDNTYLYVLKELYPMPTKNKKPIERVHGSLDIDDYDKVNPGYYSACKSRFDEAYALQIKFSKSDDKVACITTSLPIGKYEDRNSSRNGNYALYGLFQYHAGKNLKRFEENSLLELIDIQRKIAETVKAYHNHGFLWLDIKEANVNIVGENSVQSVSMFDFGSLISMQVLEDYDPDNDKELVVSFSPTSKDLLLPLELENFIKAKNRTDYPLAKYDYRDYLQLLGYCGTSSDIFLLGSLLFKRIFGKAPTKEICFEIQNDSFDHSQSKWLKNTTRFIVDKIKTILKKSLKYDDIEGRYSSANEYLTDLNEVYRNLVTAEDIKLSSGKEKEFVKSCCLKYTEEILTGKGGKFEHLQKLRSDSRFSSRVSLLSEKSSSDASKYVNPDSAIDSDRLVFLYGDGGMGKSTALYDYMKVATATAIYIELSRYKETESALKFILYTIINEICDNFRKITAAGDVESKETLKDELLTSFTQKDTINGQREYILLLDGYNEISKELRVRFDEEIEAIINTWHNVRIVIAGRDIPREINGNEIELYKDFRTFEFVGISEEERTELVGDRFPDRINSIRDDSKLWDVLRIPMFMGMFLHLGVDTTSIVHTRGEILEQFITQTEVEAAENVAKGQESNATLRKFVVQYSLPFVANYMDQNRTFTIEEYLLYENNDLAWDLYCGNKKNRRILKIKDVPAKNDDSIDYDENIIHIINIEAGYCYDTSDGKIAFTHQYYRDYFAAKQIQNILSATKALGEAGLSRKEQLDFTKDNGLDYTWSDDVCILLGEIIGDYKNEPGYTEK